MAYLNAFTTIPLLFHKLQVCMSSADSLNSLVSTIDYGINNSGLGTTVTRLALEAALMIVEEHYKMLKNSTAREEIAQICRHFMELLFNLTVLQSFDMDLLDLAAETLFATMCCEFVREVYLNILLIG